MSWLLHLFYRLVFTIYIVSFKRKKSKAGTCTCWKSTKSGFRLRIKFTVKHQCSVLSNNIFSRYIAVTILKIKMHLDKLMRLSDGLKVTKWNIYFHTHHLQILSILQIMVKYIEQYIAWPINLLSYQTSWWKYIKSVKQKTKMNKKSVSPANILLRLVLVTSKWKAWMRLIITWMA